MNIVPLQPNQVARLVATHGDIYYAVRAELHVVEGVEVMVHAPIDSRLDEVTCSCVRTGRVICRAHTRAGALGLACYILTSPRNRRLYDEQIALLPRINPPFAA